MCHSMLGPADADRQIAICPKCSSRRRPAPPRWRALLYYANAAVLGAARLLGMDGRIVDRWLAHHEYIDFQQLEECERIIVRRATTNVGSASNLANRRHIRARPQRCKSGPGPVIGLECRSRPRLECPASVVPVAKSTPSRNWLDQTGHDNCCHAPTISTLKLTEVGKTDMTYRALVVAAALLCTVCAANARSEQIERAVDQELRNLKGFEEPCLPAL